MGLDNVELHESLIEIAAARGRVGRRRDLQRRHRPRARQGRRASTRSTASCAPAAGCSSPTSSSTTRSPRTRASASISGRAESPARCSTASTRACWFSGPTPTSRRASSSTPTRARRSRTPAARPRSSARWDPRSARPSRRPSAAVSHDAGPSTADAAIYLDHNATTPIAPEVLDAMRPYLEDRFGNPSSAHRYGAVAHRAVERARAQVAALLGCEPGQHRLHRQRERGRQPGDQGRRPRAPRSRAITSSPRPSSIPAVLGACRYLERRLGYRLTILPVDGFGIGGPGGRPPRDRARDRAGQRHARQQRGRHARADRRDRRRRARASASPVTPMRRNRWARSRSTSTSSASTC